MTEWWDFGWAFFFGEPARQLHQQEPKGIDLMGWGPVGQIVDQSMEDLEQKNKGNIYKVGHVTILVSLKLCAKVWSFKYAMWNFNPKIFFSLLLFRNRIKTLLLNFSTNQVHQPVVNLDDQRIQLIRLIANESKDKT